MSTRSYCQTCGAPLDASDGECPRCAATAAYAENSLQHADPMFDALVDELQSALAPGLILMRQLGQGGMGTIFLARDPALKRTVVVKVLSPKLAHDEQARLRFEREAEAAAAVSHPNVVSVYQVGALPIAGTSYFVMRHVEGNSLDIAFPLGRPVPEARAKRVIGEVASALAAAHGRGLAHRDIKPANIMLEAESGRAIVVDFGISAALGTERKATSGAKLTEQGVSIGTPQYMSPEQASGDEVTDRSDVYSLGLVAFELLTGRPVFEEATLMAIAAAHIHKPAPSVLSLRPDADPSLAKLVDQCLLKDPAKRPSATSIAAGLLPQEAARIEWPPPGLDVIRGTASRYLSGATRLAVLVFVFAVATDGFFEDLGESTAFGLVFIMFGAVFALWYAYSIGRPARHFPRAVADARRAGFPLSVLLDVAIDVQSDTELLVNRVGPYARLDAAETEAFMRLRRYAFGITAAFVIAALMSPAAAIIASESDVLQLGLLASLGAAAVVRWACGRRERAFRRQYLRNDSAQRRVVVGPELVTTWLASAGVAPPSQSRHPWPARLFAGGFDVAVATVLFIGLFWLANLFGLSREFERDAPGISRDHVSRLREVADAARTPFPALSSEMNFVASSPASAAAFEVMLRDSISTEVARLARNAEAAIRGRTDSNSGQARDSVLTLATRYEPLGTWRTLASDSLSIFWYQDALAIRRRDSTFSDTAYRPKSALAAACRCNGPLRDIGRFAILQAASIVLAVDRGDTLEAASRVAEMTRVGRNLTRDPLTADAGSTVLGASADLLDTLALRLGRPLLAADALALRAYRTTLDMALREFLGRTAVKAMVRPIETDAVLALAGDASLQPVFRRSLARAAVFGACYQGADIFFNVDSERDELLDSMLTRIADLPEAAANAAFTRDLDWRSAPPWTGWRFRLLSAALWTSPRVQHCETLGFLRDTSVVASPPKGS